MLGQAAEAAFVAVGLKSPTSVGEYSVATLQPKKDTPF